MRLQVKAIYISDEADYFDDVDIYIGSLENADDIDEFTSKLFEQIDWDLIREMQGE